MFEYKSLDMVISDIENLLKEYAEDNNLPLLITEGSAVNGIDYCTQVLAMDVTKDDDDDHAENFILCCNFTRDDLPDKEKEDIQLDAQDVLYYLKLYRETYGGDLPVFISESTHKAGMMPCRYVGVANASVSEDDEDAPDTIRGADIDFIVLANFGQRELDEMEENYQ